MAGYVLTVLALGLVPVSVQIAEGASIGILLVTVPHMLLLGAIVTVWMHYTFGAEEDHEQKPVKAVPLSADRRERSPASTRRAA